MGVWRQVRPHPNLFWRSVVVMKLINHPAAQSVLDELHSAASDDKLRWTERSEGAGGDNARGGGDLVRLGEFYLAVSAEEGAFLYVLARAINAKRIVEFGASFGVSSIYLAAAAKDNGGTLITTEVHPEKCAALREIFDRAQLSDAVTLLEGDARETLKGVTEPVDLLFLDGWKSAYLPVFNLMRPRLKPGAIVLADNIHHEAAADYLALVSSDESGCMTVIRDDLAISYVNSDGSAG